MSTKAVYGATTFIMTTLSIKTLSITGLLAILNINDT